MYEIARNFYQEFLPEVQELADHAGQGEKYKKVIADLLAKPEHLWTRTGGSAETMKLIEEEQKLRYNQDLTAGVLLPAVESMTVKTGRGAKLPLPNVLWAFLISGFQQYSRRVGIAHH